MTHVKEHDSEIDYMTLVKGIASGIRVLHEMQLLHGDIQGSNILIDARGNPLLSDFGLSRIVGGSLTGSQGVEGSIRWLASEILRGEDDLTHASDVYAYAMTVLELITHEIPFNNLKREVAVILKVVAGERPSRPTAARVIERGLNDGLWELLGSCWLENAARRPSIQHILSRLDLLVSPRNKRKHNLISR